MTPLVCCTGLGRAYAGRDVLVGVDLEVTAGEVVALIGPNGGGKSTLLLLVAGLVTPTSGTVTLDGIAATEMAVQRSASVGLVTAEPGLYPLLTGRENLGYFAGLYGIAAAEVERRAAPLLERHTLEAAMERRVAEWSSGMRQKLSLVRALLLAPRVLLLDEPTANLDPLASRAIHEAIRAEADRGVAVMIATHDLTSADAIADEVVVLRRAIVARERTSGPRAVPPPGRLHALYARAEAHP
jgi:ABC-type multidrug transport system ATPase subunit